MQPLNEPKSKADLSTTVSKINSEHLVEVQANNNNKESPKRWEKNKAVWRTVFVQKSI